MALSVLGLRQAHVARERTDSRATITRTDGLSLMPQSGHVPDASQFETASEEPEEGRKKACRPNHDGHILRS